MIVRIVQLQFLPDQIASAKEKVEAISPRVRGFEGCQHLEILYDIHHPGKVVTYSHWDDETSLNNYRDSHIFKTFWASVKPQFEVPAQARSMRVAVRLE